MDGGGAGGADDVVTVASTTTFTTTRKYGGGVAVVNCDDEDMENADFSQRLRPLNEFTTQLNDFILHQLSENSRS